MLLALVTSTHDFPCKTVLDDGSMQITFAIPGAIMVSKFHGSRSVLGHLKLVHSRISFLTPSPMANNPTTREFRKQRFTRIA